MSILKNHLRASLAATALLLTATAALAGGSSRILWRFQLPEAYVPIDPAISPDGQTIYVVALNSDLYAIRADGTQQWVLPGVGHRGLDVGPDGTIYVGSNEQVTAVNPDGTIRWVFDIPDPEPSAFYGLGVGPDGNIYCAMTGAATPPHRGPFSLTPAGELRWMTPQYSRFGTVSSNVAFGPTPDGQGTQFVYASWGHTGRVNCATGELDLLGRGMSGRAHVVISPDGNIYRGGYAYDAAGNLLFAIAANIQAAASNGDVYSIWNGLSRLDGFDGSTVWHLEEPAPFTGSISPNPDDTLLLVAGGGSAFNPGSVKAVDTQGNFLWSQQLPVDDGRVSTMATFAVYAPDGQAAYFGSASLYQGPAPFCFLYAIQTGDQPPATPGDLDGDGDVDLTDLSALLADFGCTSNCTADIDGDGDTDLTDLSILLANFGT